MTQTHDPTTLEQVPVAAANVQNCCGTPFTQHLLIGLRDTLKVLAWYSFLFITLQLCWCLAFHLVNPQFTSHCLEDWLLCLSSDLSFCFGFSQLWLIQLLLWELLCSFHLSASGLHLSLVNQPRHCSQLLAYSSLRSNLLMQPWVLPISFPGMFFSLL